MLNQSWDMFQKAVSWDMFQKAVSWMWTYKVAVLATVAFIYILPSFVQEHRIIEQAADRVVVYSPAHQQLQAQYDAIQAAARQRTVENTTGFKGWWRNFWGMND